MRKTKDNIRTKIIAPLVAMLVVSCLVLAFFHYKIQSNYLAHDITNQTAAVEKLFAKFLENEAKFMAAQLQFIASDPGLIDAWQSRNKTELYDRASGIFQKINADFSVTHFYFIEPDKTCFLRVHSPARFGDEITRFTLRDAVVNASSSSGIELGPLGTFTLRVVFPWVSNGKLLGYLELGEEIEHLTPRLKEISGLDLIFTVDKSNLVKEKWQSGMQFLDKVGNWDEFTDFVITGKTLKSLPSELKNIVRQNHNQTILRQITLNDRLMSVYAHPLRDVSGRQVGNVTTLYDITDITMEARKITGLFVAAMLGIFILMLLFYYIYSGRIERQILNYRDNLEDLVRERTRELHIAMDEVKVLSGFLPICASCKRIRDDEGYWKQIESYISKHSEAEFTHGICPECIKKLYPDIVGKDGEFKK